MRAVIGGLAGCNRMTILCESGSFACDIIEAKWILLQLRGEENTTSGVFTEPLTLGAWLPAKCWLKHGGLPSFFVGATLRVAAPMGAQTGGFAGLGKPVDWCLFA